MVALQILHSRAPCFSFSAPHGGAGGFCPRSCGMCLPPPPPRPAGQLQLRASGVFMGTNKAAFFESCRQLEAIGSVPWLAILRGFFCFFGLFPSCAWRCGESLELHYKNPLGLNFTVRRASRNAFGTDPTVFGVCSAPKMLLSAGMCLSKRAGWHRWAVLCGTLELARHGIGTEECPVVLSSAPVQRLRHGATEFSWHIHLASQQGSYT